MTTLAHDPAGRDPLGLQEAERRRKHLAAAIDFAVDNHLSDDLLGRLVRQAYSLRYYGSEEERLNRMIFEMIDRYTRRLIVDWIKEHEDELYEGVEARLKEQHLGPLGAVITDEFMNDLAKGNR